MLVGVVAAPGGRVAELFSFYYLIDFQAFKFLSTTYTGSSVQFSAPVQYHPIQSSLVIRIMTAIISAAAVSTPLSAFVFAYPQEYDGTPHIPFQS